MTYRRDIPEPTSRISRLPVRRGYPVPWFVAWLDEAGEPVPRGEGTPDFRVLFPGVVAKAHNQGRCWICGEPLGVYRAFVVGPMCAVNRVSAEPPSHAGCAEWSARACPFLARPKMIRRDAGMPEGTEKPAGIMLERNPGVALVWVTRAYGLRPVPNGVLFDIGDPERVAWFAEGREATRDEVMASVESGIPTLREMAESQGPNAVRMLEREVVRAMALLP